MATFTWNAYIGAGPAWADIGANTIVFCSSLTDLATNITVGAFQDGTHLGNGDPGADQCGANHANNVKYLTGSTMSVNGAGSEDITDANLAEIECTLKLNFAHGSAVALSSVLFYCFDGSTPATRATGLDVFCFERGVSASAWTEINDDSGGQGGTGNGKSLESRSADTSHDYFLALSASPESVGAKTAFDFGISLVYS